MSSELSHASLQRASARRWRLFLWWRKPRPKFAHPWSAYKPETYLAGRPPAGIVMATKAQALLPAPASLMTVPDAALDLAIVQSPATAARVIATQLVPTSARATPVIAAAVTAAVAPAPPLCLPAPPPLLLLAAPAKASSAPASVSAQDHIAPRPRPAPVVLKLVDAAPALAAPREPLPMLPGFSGRDFQLAARLQSVAVLNRSAEALVTAAARQAALAHLRATHGINRRLSAQQIPSSRRIRSIEPPAVLRKARKSADVIELRLAPARVEPARSRNSA